MSTFTRREKKDNSRHFKEADQGWNSWEASDSLPVWPLWLQFRFCHAALKALLSQSYSTLSSEPCYSTQSTCCPRSGPAGRGQRGAKPRDSRESRGRSVRRGVKSLGQKPAGSEEHRVVWLEGNEHPLSCRVHQIPPPGSAEIKLGVFQPHAFLTTPTVPGCGLVLCSAKLCDFFWWAGSHTLWAGLNSVCPCSLASLFYN